MNTRTFKRFCIKRSLLALLSVPALAFAAGSHDMGGMHGGHDMPGMQHGGTSDGHASAAGRPGDPAKVSRTVLVQMDDTMRFAPAEITVKAGETIRFFIVNKGKLAHEMVIGTSAELDEYAEMMRKMPGMKHAEPNQLTLEAGQRGGIVWTFDRAGTFAFACLVPGHKEAGMVGKFVVQP